MKRELFSCDYCDIEKFNSENQQYENVPFVCETLAHWKQHIKRPKHCLSVVRNKNLEDDLVVECKHCNGIYTKDQYRRHKERNNLLWVSKSFAIYKDCSCNNFCYGKKRFESIQEVREYANAKDKYTYGKDNKTNYTKKVYDKALEILNDRQEHENKLNEIRRQNEADLRKELDEKRAKEAKELEEKKKKKAKEKQRQQPIEEKIIKENPIAMTIEDEYNKLNNIKDSKQDKNDCNIKPIWDSEDMCCECGLNTNVWREYPIEKLKNWDVKLCECEDETDSEDEQEKII
tara:strand:- start:143 stop:1009 length:867 start_codon:yes stop_codon:yes gene_type:complete